MGKFTTRIFFRCALIFLYLINQISYPLYGINRFAQFNRLTDSPTHRLTLLTQFIRLTDSQRLTTTHNDSQRPTTTHNESQRLTTTHNDSQRLTTTHNDSRELFFRFITSFEMIVTFSISVILFSFYSKYILDEIYAVLKVIQLPLTLGVLYISLDFL